jgi:hypothetical protein
MGDRAALKWKRDFEEFCCSGATPPPEKITTALKEKISRSLTLAPWLVFVKLCVVALVGGTLSLYFCPQFGLGHPGHETFLMRAFMRLGETGCTLACAATFSVISLLFAVLVLTTAEVRLVARKKFLQIPAVALVALGGFICAGAQVLLEAAILWWFAGAIIGLATFEVGWRVRSYVLRLAH